MDERRAIIRGAMKRSIRVPKTATAEDILEVSVLKLCLYDPNFLTKHPSPHVLLYPTEL
jgi:hypothetical protein